MYIYFMHLYPRVLEPDALRFPVSLLTACATIDGAIESLILKYQSNVRSGGEIGHARRAHFRTKASKAVVTVRLDIQEVLQYSDVCANPLYIHARWVDLTFCLGGYQRLQAMVAPCQLKTFSMVASASVL